MPQQTIQPSPLVELIVAEDDAVRDQSLASVCENLSDVELLAGCEALDAFWQSSENLYERVRALMFLFALHRFILPERGLCGQFEPVPETPTQQIFGRRYEHAIRQLLSDPDHARSSDTLASGLATAYHGLALQCLFDQVRRCVRSVPGNQWMFRTGHPSEIPLRIRPELLDAAAGALPVLVERTAVRMDLSHSCWSDIFFLAMDRPEFARVLNVSINLCEKDAAGGPRPPVEAWFRVIDAPVIRLVSVDLGASVEIRSLSEVFDFGRDYLGLLKAAIVAAGLVPPGLEGCGAELGELLEPLVGAGKGFELVSCVYNIPKGSRLAVSTNLMAALIAVCMRASGQIQQLDGGLTEKERSMLAARAILGEWLGGSGGGWQDSGGVWPGIKLIEGCRAEAGDAEAGVSRGRLLPRHTVFDRAAISDQAREKLQNSLILIHGGLAQNVGPILEMVTERYLLRDTVAWEARQEALRYTREIFEALHAGDIRQLADLTTRNFFGPIKTIIPWASNAFTEALIAEVSEALGEAYWGFWMLGGMSGGGMGFIVAPQKQAEAKRLIKERLAVLKQRFEHALPFAIDPVIYDFSINEAGSVAAFGAIPFPLDYYRLRLPSLMRQDPASWSGQDRSDLRVIRELAAAGDGLQSRIIETLLPEPDAPDKGPRGGEKPSSSLEALLTENGFDPLAHEKTREALLAGRIGLSQNRLSADTVIEDARPADLIRATGDRSLIQAGAAAIAAGEVAVVTLAAGAGSRWTQGAGVVKALHPFAVFDGRYRNFIEVHLAKTRRAELEFSAEVPHVFTTSYLTHTAIEAWARDASQARPPQMHLSRGASVGLRLVPTLRDLRFAWEESPQPQLDVQAQKMRESVRAALKRWTAEKGEASDYRDNLPLQCLHPVGHWYEIPGLLLNGTLDRLIQARPSLKTLLLHNIDTLGASVDPELLGRHLASGNSLSYEVISRRFDDSGGGLARVNGRLRLVEGLALPSEADEFKLTYYNTLTSWIDIDALLTAFGLQREDLSNPPKLKAAVRAYAEKMPVYITLKEVKKRWGRGQEDIFPVLQFERLWGDMSAMSDLKTGYFHVPRLRGQQLKDPAQLDPWYRDGSHRYVDRLCAWNGSSA